MAGLGAGRRRGHGLACLPGVHPRASLLPLNQRRRSPAQPSAERKNAMNTHPYLRAFLAGIFVPTLILPGMLLLFLLVHYAYQPSFPVERSLIFPMSLLPVGSGLWNVTCRL